MTSIRHTNVLKPSSPDDIALGLAVEDKFLVVCGLYKRLRGVEIPIQTSMDVDMVRWRLMRVRHKQGDHRHTEAEWKSTQAIAQWTMDWNCELRNQPKQVLQWQN